MIQMVPCRTQLKPHASVAICERVRERERERARRTSPRGLLNKPGLAPPPSRTLMSFNGPISEDQDDCPCIYMYI